MPELEPLVPELEPLVPELEPLVLSLVWFLEEQVSAMMRQHLRRRPPTQRKRALKAKSKACLLVGSTLGWP